MIETPSKTNLHITVIGIMPRALEFGISRMWQAYSDETPWKLVIVKSLRECEEYLSKSKS